MIRNRTQTVSKNTIWREQSHSGAGGFTLLELLVVVAIIGLLSAVVITSLNTSRSESRNAAVLAQMAEYEKALNLYFSDNGQYPTPTAWQWYNRRYCIGEGAHSSGCWPGAISTTGPLEAALVPNYLASAPGFDQGNLGSPVYMSCTGTTALTPNGDRLNPEICGPNKFSLLFVLEGLNQDCGRAVMVDGGFESDEGDYTLCRLNMI